MLLRRIFLLAIGCLLGPALLAAPIKIDSLKAGDRTYRDVTVLGANITDLYFSHAGGIANVKLKYLSPELQKRFHFDPAAASAAERAQAEEDARYQSGLALSAAAEASAAKRELQPPSRSSEENLVDPISDKSLLGKPGPKLEVEKWITDKPEMEGKFVLISFWAPWSVPCRKCIPDLNQLQKKFADRLVVVGVSSEPEPEAPASPEKIAFALATDSTAKLGQAAGVTSVPCVLLLDPAGVVRYQGHPAAITDKKLQMIMEKATE